MSKSKFVEFLQGDMESLARDSSRIQRIIAQVKHDNTRTDAMKDRLLSRLQKLLNRDSDDRVSNRLYADLAKVAPSTINSIMDGFFAPDSATVAAIAEFSGRWALLLEVYARPELFGDEIVNLVEEIERHPNREAVISIATNVVSRLGATK